MTKREQLEQVYGARMMEFKIAQARLTQAENELLAEIQKPVQVTPNAEEVSG